MFVAFSDWLSRQEKRLCGWLMVAVTILIVLNVIGRMMNRALFWADETAVFLMVWALFLSMAVLLKERQAVAVTVLVDQFPASLRRVVGVVVDWTVLLFAVLILVLCWQWYMPAELWRVGFDLEAFSAETINFVYEERPNTLTVPKFLIWLIVPYFGLSLLVHALANIVAEPAGRHMDLAGDMPAGQPMPAHTVTMDKEQT